MGTDLDVYFGFDGDLNKIKYFAEKLNKNGFQFFEIDREYFHPKAKELIISEKYLPLTHAKKGAKLMVGKRVEGEEWEIDIRHKLEEYLTFTLNIREKMIVCSSGDIQWSTFLINKEGRKMIYEMCREISNHFKSNLIIYFPDCGLGIKGDSFFHFIDQKKTLKEAFEILAKQHKHYSIDDLENTDDPDRNAFYIDCVTMHIYQKQ